MTALGPVTLVFYPPRQVDGHGDELPGTSTPFEIEGCSVSPTTTTEASGTQSTVTDRLSALVPADRSLFSSKMRVLYDGEMHNVHGKPARWTFMDGSAACTEIVLVSESDA